MKTVILCEGKGRRLDQETEYKPKPIMEIGSGLHSDGVGQSFPTPDLSEKSWPMSKEYMHTKKYTTCPVCDSEDFSVFLNFRIRR